MLLAAGSTVIQQPVRVVELTRRQDVSLHALLSAVGVGGELPDDAVITADLEIKYEGYFARERDQAERMRRMGEFALEADLAYDAMQSLSFEARQKLAVIRPLTLAQAARIPGVSPSDLQNLVLEIGKRRRMAPR
jgi:tRNA uridine 5-carboxymethylaminomethyl modification enzyme